MFEMKVDYTVHLTVTDVQCESTRATETQGIYIMFSEGSDSRYYRLRMNADGANDLFTVLDTHRFASTTTLWNNYEFNKDCFYMWGNFPVQTLVINTQTTTPKAAMGTLLNESDDNVPNSGDLTAFFTMVPAPVNLATDLLTINNQIAAYSLLDV